MRPKLEATSRIPGGSYVCGKQYIPPASNSPLLTARVGALEKGQYLTEYPRDIREFLPEILRLIPAKSIQSALKCSRRFAYSLRNGERQPGKRSRVKVIVLTAQFARDKLRELNEPRIPANDEEAILRCVNRLRNSRGTVQEIPRNPGQPHQPRRARISGCVTYPPR